jgi:holo-ACP synthase CitX
VLAARDARQVVLDRLREARWPALVMLSLAIPGEDKVPPGALRLFDWAQARLPEELPGIRQLHRGDDALGPFSLWGAPQPALAAKQRCVALEAARPAARLLDLDVYPPAPGVLDRAALRLPPRPCLCCDQPARECIRAGRHGPAALASRAAALLAGP